MKVRFRDGPGREPAATERGSLAVEFAIVVMPTLLIFSLLLGYAARVSEMNGRVDSAASEAVRAASLRGHVGDAAEDAEAVAKANLERTAVPCMTVVVAVDTSDFRPGGTVTVTVSCAVAMTDLNLLGVPASKTFRSTRVEVIDTYRGDG